MNYRSLSAIGEIADKRRFLACDGLSANDPTATLAVHYGRMAAFGQSAGISKGDMGNAFTHESAEFPHPHFPMCSQR